MALIYMAPAPEQMSANDWQTRKNVQAVYCSGGAFWVEHFVCRHDIVGNRWGSVPGMWVVNEGYSYTGHVVDDFGDLVEVCGFYGD